MTDSRNKLSQFWQELKHRNVIRVISVYAATAFVILELVDIVAPSLGLPAWTLNLVIVLLCVGFVIAVAVSWIYDFHPLGGIVKTEPAKKRSKKDISRYSNSWKIATYISFVVIVALIVLNVIPRNKRSEVKEILDKSIAVLPFRNESSDQENTYFINGLMESILDNLSKIEDLRVISRNSVEQYRNNPKPTPAVAEEMNVSYVVEGSGQKLGNRLLLTIQLITGTDDDHIWSKQYDREIQQIEDLINIQSEIAQLVASEIEALITPEEKQLIEKAPTANLTAYDFYLRGIEEYWRYWAEHNFDHINKSIEYYAKAIELDPRYSLAYSGLARGYWMLGHYAPKPLPDYWKESKRLSNRAIELDPENSLAYTELGVVQHNWDWDSSAARYSFEKALAISPNDDYSYVGPIWLEYRLGNCSKLASLIEEKYKINSREGQPSKDLLLLTCQKDFEEIRRIGDQEWNKNMGIQSSFYFYMAYIEDGNYDMAFKIAKSIEDNSSDRIISISIKGHILALIGEREEAFKMLEELKMLSESRSVSKIYFANIYYALGEKEKTLKYLELALQERDWRIHSFRDPTAFNLIDNDEPWLQDIIRRSWIPLNDTQ